MSKTHLFIPLLFILCSLATAQAESVLFPSGLAAWRVDITYPELKQSTPPQTIADATAPHPIVKPKTLEITRSDSIRRTVITWTDGSISQRWRIEKVGITATEIPHHVGIYVIPDADTMTSASLKTISSESDFKWTQYATLKSPDPVTYAKKKCLFYEAKVERTEFEPMPMASNPNQAPTDPPRITCKLWVDFETHYPVALDNGIALYTFTFLPTPASPLVMPDKFKNELDQYQLSRAPAKMQGRVR